MKSKFLISAAATLLFTASASASADCGCHEEPVLDYSTFSSGITYTFDDTLKRSVFKGPILTQDVPSAFNNDIPSFRNIKDYPSLKYSLFIDDGVIKMDYVHTYRAEENKNFHKLVDFRGRSYTIQNVKNIIEDCRGQTSYANARTCLVKESGIVQLDPHMKYKYQFVATNGQNLDFELNVDYMDAITDFHKTITSPDNSVRQTAQFKHKKLDELRHGGRYNPAENRARGERIYDPEERFEKAEREERVRRQAERRADYRNKMEHRKYDSVHSEYQGRPSREGGQYQYHRHSQDR